MKYTHVIYNSSEKNQAGTVGFGVRCSTEGTPDQLISALEENEVFTFSEVGPSLTPSALAAVPEAIRSIVPTYFFRVISLSGRQRKYVLGRKIAVGFDYTFYLNGKPGRLGNYVVDTYVFDETPSAAEFEIFLENPAPGSNHFIPASPVPSLENIEMRDISLGHKPTLPDEEKSFAASGAVVFTEKGFDLLFAFIRSRKEGKPLLVKAPVDAPSGLIAQLALLLPQNQIENMTFLTNHAEEGKKKGINIVFINEHYSFEIFRKQWEWLDLDDNNPYVSKESELFRETIIDYVSKGDLKSVHNLVAWCLSDMYEKAKQFSPQTQKQLYNYLFDVANFDIRLMKSDPDLKRTLAEHFLAFPSDKHNFDVALQDYHESLNSVEDLFEWIDFVLAMSQTKSSGEPSINCSNVISANKDLITKNVFDDAKSFLKFYEHYEKRFGKVQEFINSDEYLRHEDFLHSPGCLVIWQQLYPLFLDRELIDNHEALVEKMFEYDLDDNIDPSSPWQQVLNKEKIDIKEYITILVALLAKKGSVEESRVAKVLSTVLKDRNDINIDFFSKFPDKITEPCYTDLYVWQLRHYPLKYKDEILNLTKNILTFLQNDYAIKWGSDKTKGQQVFNRLYDALKDALIKGRLSNEEVNSICSQIIDSEYPQPEPNQFKILQMVVGHEKVDKSSNINKLWEIASRLDDREYLKYLLPMIAPKVNQKEIDNFCKFIIEKELMTPAALWEFGQALPLKLHYSVGAIKYAGMEAQEKLDFLMSHGSKSDEEAMEFLMTYFPKSHEKIMKSREPSVMQKMTGMFKNLFGKKGKKDDIK
ncbi:MAG: hypothetical protein K2J82_03540 [Muribaculaceae bacterium]|nr:hypothetical protein [Muribaculaceae bacterium]MDE6753667.1 hypothetical protein [Muribaculaceae bacterium]